MPRAVNPLIFLDYPAQGNSGGRPEGGQPGSAGSQGAVGRPGQRPVPIRFREAGDRNFCSCILEV